MSTKMGKDIEVGDTLGGSDGKNLKVIDVTNGVYRNSRLVEHREIDGSKYSTVFNSDVVELMK